MDLRAILVGAAAGVFFSGCGYFWRKHNQRAPDWVITAASWLTTARALTWNGLNVLFWSALAAIAAFSLALTVLPNLDPSLRAAEEALKAISVSLHSDLYPPMAGFAWIWSTLGCALKFQSVRKGVLLSAASLAAWHLLSFGLERLWA